MSKLSADTSRFLFSTEGKTFLVLGFAVKEEISCPFSATVELASGEEIAEDSLPGRIGLLTMESDEEDRHVHGIIRTFYRTGFKGHYYLYQAVLAPQSHLLELRSDCRIFQNRNVPDIVTEVLKTAGLTADLFTFRLQDKYPKRVYCVQYRETDFAFISRLLAEEGIFFFFEHSPDGHLLVFGDSTACHQPIAGTDTVPWNTGCNLVAEQEAVLAFKRGGRLCTGRFALRDFNFERPAMDLTAADQDQDNDHLAQYDFPGGYDQPEQGRRLSRVRLQTARVKQTRAFGKSAVPRFAPGFTFQLTGDGIGNMQDTYLITQTEHKGEQPQVLAEHSDSGKGTSYGNTFTAMPASVTFRPDGSLLKKPFVRGPQTAIVTGPAGEEIYTDRHGRVKVQFHWDRQGRRDEHSSCWIRVSQGWAGAGWGAMHIPRIDQEVIVDFIEGDPDRPLITGRVYHGTNLPPYALPEHKTRSTIKSDTTPGGNGANELRFEDKKEAEEIYLHGQKDLNIAIENDKGQRIGRDESLDVGNNRVKTVAKDQQETIGAGKTTQVGENYEETIGRNKTIQVGADHSEAIKRNADITVGGDMTRTIVKSEIGKIGEDLTVNVGGNADEKVGGHKDVDVGQGIRIYANGRIHTLSNEQVTIESGNAVVVVKNSGAIHISGTDITVNATGTLALKGAKVFAN